MSFRRLTPLHECVTINTLVAFLCDTRRYVAALMLALTVSFSRHEAPRAGHRRVSSDRTTADRLFFSARVGYRAGCGHGHVSAARTFENAAVRYFFDACPSGSRGGPDVSARRTG